MKFIHPENSKFKCIVLIKCQGKKYKNYRSAEKAQQLCLLPALPEDPGSDSSSMVSDPLTQICTYRQNSNARNIKVILKLLSLGMVIHACETKAGILLYRWKPTHLIYFANSRKASYVIFVKTTLKKLNQIVVFFYSFLHEIGNVAQW